MNWGQIKDPVYRLCLAGTVVASWSVTLEATNSNPFNNEYFSSLNSLKTFWQNSTVRRSMHDCHRRKINDERSAFHNVYIYSNTLLDIIHLLANIHTGGCT